MPVAEPGTPRRAEAPQRGAQVAALDHAPEQQAVVETQLGRAVRGRWRVARSCHLGLPMAIESHPVLDGNEPFPTLYWLTCPILLKRVSRLESDGAMNDVNAALDAHPELKRRLLAAIGRYRAARDAHAVIGDAGAPPGGGPDRVKCLHAHVAHELAGGANPIGALALAASDWPDCIAPCVEVTP